jgi:hypothetical protein
VRIVCRDSISVPANIPRPPDRMSQATFEESEQLQTDINRLNVQYQLDLAQEVGDICGLPLVS